MEKVEDFHINYWGTQEIDYGHGGKKRSPKRKLGIVIAFLFVLAMLPIFTFGYGQFKNDQAKKVSVITNPIPSSIPTSTPVIRKVVKPTAIPNQDVVIKGDNYWRISKRNCGTGKAYLTIQAINGGKPLQPGDTLIISCSF